MDKIKGFTNRLPFKISPYVLIIAVLVIVIIFSLTGRRSQDQAFDEFMAAYVACDAEGIVKLMPKEYISVLIDSGEIDTKADLINGIQAMLDYWLTVYGREEFNTYEYKIAYKLETEQGDSCDEFYHLEYVFGDHADKIKEICIIHYDPKIQVIGYDDKVHTKDLSRCDVSLVKIGQSWYVTDFTYLKNWI